MTAYTAQIERLTDNGSTPVIVARTPADQHTHAISFSRFLPSANMDVSIAIHVPRGIANTARTHPDTLLFRFEANGEFEITEEISSSDEHALMGLINAGLNLTLPDRIVIEDLPQPSTVRRGTSRFASPRMYVSSAHVRAAIPLTEVSYEHRASSQRTYVNMSFPVDDLPPAVDLVDIPNATVRVVVEGTEFGVSITDFEHDVGNRSIHLHGFVNEEDMRTMRGVDLSFAPDYSAITQMDLSQAEARVLGSMAALNEVAGPASHVGERMRNTFRQIGSVIPTLFRTDPARTFNHTPREHPMDDTYTPEITRAEMQVGPDNYEEVLRFREQYDLPISTYLALVDAAETYDLSLAQLVEAVLRNGNQLEESAAAAGVTYRRMIETLLQSMRSPNANTEAPPSFRRYGVPYATFVGWSEDGFFAGERPADIFAGALPYYEVPMEDRMVFAAETLTSWDEAEYSREPDISFHVTIPSLPPTAEEIAEEEQRLLRMAEEDGIPIPSEINPDTLSALAMQIREHRERSTPNEPGQYALAPMPSNVPDVRPMSSNGQTIAGIPIQMASGDTLNTIADRLGMSRHSDIDGIETDEELRERILSAMRSDNMASVSSIAVNPQAGTVNVDIEVNPNRPIPRMFGGGGGAGAVHFTPSEGEINTIAVSSGGSGYVSGRTSHGGNNQQQSPRNNAPAHTGLHMRVGDRNIPVSDVQIPTVNPGAPKFDRIADFRSAFRDAGRYPIEVKIKGAVITVYHDSRDTQAMQAKLEEVRPHMPVTLTLTLGIKNVEPAQFVKRSRRIKIN